MATTMPRVHDIPFGRPMLSHAERALVAEVLEGTQLTQGRFVRQFETAFARFTGAAHAVATSSCMGALHLAYLHLGLHPGDEVIVPAQTHVATAMAVELCNGRCVFVDSEPATGNIDLDQVEAAITPRTRAISVVHYLGMPVDMRRLTSIARRHGLFVVEDCALALGARCDGVHVGLLGDVGTFSFYPVKHITTGEGGMLITRRAEVAESAARQRAFGVERASSGLTAHAQYDATSVGLNYRMTEVSGAIGVAQMARLPEFLAARARNHALFAEVMDGVEGASLLRSSHDHLESAHYAQCIVLDDRLAPCRDAIGRRLAEHGIGVSVYYPRPVPAMTYFAEKYGLRDGAYPVATRISTHSLALPVGPHVSAHQVERIARELRAAVELIGDA